MSHKTSRPIRGQKRVPLAAWPSLLIGDPSTLPYIGKPWTGQETDFVIERVLRAWFEHQGMNAKALERVHMLESPEGARIYQACAEAMRRARKAGSCVLTHAEHVEHITGEAPRLSSKGGIGPSRYRMDGRALRVELDLPGTHPQLRSYSEVAVDAVLGASIPNWSQHHAHDVRLSALVPEAEASLFDSRFSVDTVLVRDGVVIGVVEVGRGALLRDEAYVARRAVKRDILEKAGYALHCCDLPPGPRSIHVLRETADWVVGRFGRGVTPTEDEVKELVVSARAEAVLLFDLEHLTPYLRHWQQELGSAPLTWKRYSDRRAAMLDAGVAAALSIPAQATLRRMLRASGETMARLSGGGRRRGQPAHLHDGRRARRPYDELRAYVQSLGVRTPAEYRAHHDPTLPRDPKAVYPQEFPLDGWSGFLGTGARNADVLGMVSSSRIPRIAGFAWTRWRAVADGLEPDALRPPRTNQTRARAYFRPVRVVPFLVERGLIAAADSKRVLAQLESGAVAPKDGVR